MSLLHLCAKLKKNGQILTFQKWLNTIFIFYSVSFQVRFIWYYSMYNLVQLNEICAWDVTVDTNRIGCDDLISKNTFCSNLTYLNFSLLKWVLKDDLDRKICLLHNEMHQIILKLKVEYIFCKDLDLITTSHRCNNLKNQWYLSMSSSLSSILDLPCASAGKLLP